MKRIEKLTAEQAARLPQIRDEWLKIGLSTEPANREKAEEGVQLADELVGLASEIGGKNDRQRA